MILNNVVHACTELIFGSEMYSAATRWFSMCCKRHKSEFGVSRLCRHKHTRRFRTRRLRRRDFAKMGRFNKNGSTIIWMLFAKVHINPPSLLMADRSNPRERIGTTRATRPRFPEGIGTTRFRFQNRLSQRGPTHHRFPPRTGGPPPNRPAAA